MSSRVLSAVLLLVGPLTPALDAKRLPPPEVKPVTAGAVEYHATHERYLGGGKPAGLRNFVEARDKRTGKVVWKVKVYEINYRPDLETDVQDVYISALEWTAAGGLLVRTERKEQSYRIDVDKKTVTTEPVALPPRK